MGFTRTPSTRKTSSPNINIEMQMITTIVEMVEMDSNRVIMIRSAELVKSLNILDMRRRRTTLRTWHKGIFSFMT